MIVSVRRAMLTIGRDVGYMHARRAMASKVAWGTLATRRACFVWSRERPACLAAWLRCEELGGTPPPISGLPAFAGAICFRSARAREAA